MKKTSFIVAILFSLFSDASSVVKNQNTDIIIYKLQKRWDEIRTFQAKFRQSVYSKQLTATDESSGTLSIRKPDKLRWVSDTDQSFQILNGKKLTLVQKHKRRNITQVDIYADVSAVMDARLLKFLAGKTKFKTHYRFEPVSDTKDTATVRFIPRARSDETIVAEIDKKSYLLRSLTSETQESRIRLELLDIQTNPRLMENLFEYTPKPSDIVHMQ